jgi:hypothetical protein
MNEKRRAVYHSPEARRARREQIEALQPEIRVPPTYFCTACNTEKPSTEFYSNRNSKVGLTARCKTCMCEYMRARHADPDKRAADIIKGRVYRRNSRVRRSPEKVAEDAARTRLKTMKRRIAVEICERMGVDLETLAKERIDDIDAKLRKVQ